MPRRHSGSKQPGYRNRYDLEVPQPVSGRRRRFFGKVGQAQNGLKQLVSFGTSMIPVPGLNYVADLLIDTLLLGDVTALLDAAKLRLNSY